MQLPKSKIFLIFCLAFIAGVFLGRYFSYQIMAIAAMFFVVVGTVWFKSRTFFILSIAGVVMLAGATRFKINYSQNDILQFYEQKAQIIGVIVEEPDERSDKTLLTLGHLIINNKVVRSKLLLTVSRFPETEYGQKLSLEAKIQEPKEYEDFSYKNYLSRFGIDGMAYQPKVEVIQGNFGNPVKLEILKIKKKFTEAVAQTLPEPQNSFLGGLLLGARRSIPADLIAQFNRTGTSHIVAVSGYNITIIASAIEGLLAWFGLRKRLSFVLSVLAIIVFVIMTGATASVVRAGIMGILLLVALNLGRVNTVANSLALTAAIMLAVNPQVLAFDIGFQLSFAALLGIVYLAPLIDKYFIWLPKFWRQYLLSTLSAQIFALPILMYYFGQLSLVAIIANILVLPVVPITMFFGFLNGGVALISAKLAVPFAAISWLLLTYILKVISFLSSWSFATLSVHMNIYWFVIYYLILVLIIMYFSKKKSLEIMPTLTPDPSPVEGEGSSNLKIT